MVDSMKYGKFRFSFKDAVLQPDTVFTAVILFVSAATLSGVADGFISVGSEAVVKSAVGVVLAAVIVGFFFDRVLAQRIDHYRRAAEQLMKDSRVLVSWRNVRDAERSEGSFIEVASVYERLNDGSVNHHGWYVKLSGGELRVYSYVSDEGSLVDAGVKAVKL